jgi:LemA protein
MNTGVAIGLFIGVPLLVLGLFLLVSYNRFVSQVTLVDEAWSQVDVELQRRHDLVPNLVNTVKGYAEHERTVLERLTAARVAADAHRGDPPGARRPFEEELTGAVHGLIAVAEAYPDLKASANFLHLQKELTNTEDRIAAGRRFYNGNVRALNTRVRTLPSNLVASMFGFSAREFFELSDPVAAQPPALGL